MTERKNTNHHRNENDYPPNSYVRLRSHSGRQTLDTPGHYRAVYTKKEEWNRRTPWTPSEHRAGSNQEAFGISMKLSFEYQHLLQPFTHSFIQCASSDWEPKARDSLKPSRHGVMDSSYKALIHTLYSQS